MYTGNPMWDALGSMSIGAVLIVVAILVGIQIKALLIGQSAEHETEDRLRELLLKQDGVEEIYRLITMQLGTSLMVAVKAKMKAVTSKELIADINRAEVAMRAEFPEIQWLFFEPDVTDEKAKARLIWPSSPRAPSSPAPAPSTPPRAPRCT
jgi:divalent metal cation (Fe/Co/Zn/Cd) transporter